MNLRKLNYLHHRFAFLKAWYFLIPAVIFALLAVQGLRSNYSTMVELREAVYAADRQDGDIEAALNDLRRHVHGHMNTNLASGSNAIKPPIQLKASYDRLMADQLEKIKAGNARVTATAENICGARFPAGGFNAPRVACVQDYVGAHAQKASDIPDSLYKFDFVTPRWSPDLAGFSIFFSALFFVLFLARFGFERYMKKKLQ